MGKTNRQEPRNGQFKKLRGNKKQRNKRQRSLKASLQKEIGFSNRNPDTGFVNCWDIPNDEAVLEVEKGEEYE